MTWDLKEQGNKNDYILCTICTFSQFLKGTVIPNKGAETVVNALNYDGCVMMGFPSDRFWSDNGSKFQNVKMDKLVSKQ